MDQHKTRGLNFRWDTNPIYQHYLKRVIAHLLVRWKMHESCMLAMGCVKSLIVDKVTDGNAVIDMKSFLTQVVLADLQHPGWSILAFSYFAYLQPGLVSRFGKVPACQAGAWGLAGLDLLSGSWSNWVEGAALVRPLCLFGRTSNRWSTLPTFYRELEKLTCTYRKE